MVQVLLAATGEAWEADVVRTLSRPGSSLVLVRRCMDVVDAVATAASGLAEVVLVGRALPGLDSDVLARLVEVAAVPVGVVDDLQGADARALRAMGLYLLVEWSRVDELAQQFVGVENGRRAVVDAGTLGQGWTAALGQSGKVEV